MKNKMKNIHVIQTDKPSRMAYDFYEKFYLLSEDTQFFEFQNLVQNRELYITSDEEIENCWFVNLTNNEIGYIKNNIGTQKNAKKIILTTDQNLIKDGVQAIDDEFLKWFVSKANDSGVPIDIVDVISIMPKGYKIIIPKEAQKQHLIDIMKFDEELELYDVNHNTQIELLSDLAKKLKNKQEINPEDIFNDEKREGVKRVIDQHKVLKGLSLVNPLHLQMTSDGHGEFPDSYKLTEKGIQYIIDKLNKK